MLYAQQLDLYLQSGELIEVIEQPRLWLGVPENVYVPDFLCIPSPSTGGTPYMVDVKGVETSAFKRNKKLWASYGRLDLHIVKRKGNSFVTTEVITPRQENNHD